MDSFIYKNPTELIFGIDTHKNAGEKVKEYADKILLVRIRTETLQKIGIYDDIMSSLKQNGIEFIELDGILPNPRLSKVREGAKICMDNGIKFILAVGGGSVVDSAKAIAAAVYHECDYWDLFTGKVKYEKSIDLGVVLTYPATGTEMNASCVITNDETLEKRGNSLANPVFSILNPQVCKALPKERMAQGVVDMLAHAMERYFTNTEGVDLTDRMLEGVMKTIVELGYKYHKYGYDYNTASQLMYAATVAHNYSLCVGRGTDWGSHQLGHELSAEYDISHGESLSLAFPAWIKFVRDHNKQRMAQFFVNTFNVSNNFLDVDDTIDRGIEALEKFYKSIDMPVRISETAIENFDIEKLSNRATNNGTITKGGYVKIGLSEFKKIYELMK